MGHALTDPQFVGDRRRCRRQAAPSLAHSLVLLLWERDLNACSPRLMRFHKARRPTIDPDEVPDDLETEAGPLAEYRVGFTFTHERLEEVFPTVLGCADSGVADAKDNRPVPIYTLDSNAADCLLANGLECVC